MESKRVYLILAIVVVTVIAVVFHLRENNKAKLLEMKVAPNQTKFDLRASGTFQSKGKHE